MKCNLFTDDPLLLNASYAVRAPVSVDELLQFGLLLEGKDVEVTTADSRSFSVVRRVRFLVYLSGFRRLSREWRFRGGIAAIPIASFAFQWNPVSGS
jgi:hypothetical protein